MQKIGSHLGKVDVWNDEECQAKLQKCLELLLAAGYFRARIQGLPPFDKIVGGIAWCIETCCIDLDVDLLYHDNLTIGQKISLTERLVSALPVLSCPHRLQPHQLQGLDAASILPVLQWLVREALSRRAQLGPVSRAVAALHCPRPASAVTPVSSSPSRQPCLRRSLSAIECQYRCVRRWCALVPVDRPFPQRVRGTLLEYSTAAPAVTDHSVVGDTCSAVRPETEHSGQLPTTQKMQDNARVAASLLSAAAASLLPPPQVTSSAISERVSALQLTLPSLQLQAGQLLQGREQLLHRLNEERQHLLQAQHQQQQVQLPAEYDSKMVQLLASVEAVRAEEQHYKEDARRQLSSLAEDVRAAEARLDVFALTPLREVVARESGRTEVSRGAAAAAARDVAALRRTWDDTPGRAELAQYRHRLTELDDLVSSSGRQTTQFRTLLTTLTLSRAAMTRHLTLLNTLLDDMQCGDPNLLAQVEDAVESTRRGSEEVCTERARQEAAQRASSASLCALQDTARLYTRTAHALAHHLHRTAQ